MQEIKCKCGKLLAKYDNGIIYLYCKSCKKEIPIKIINKEPKSQAK